MSEKTGATSRRGNGQIENEDDWQEMALIRRARQASLPFISFALFFFSIGGRFAGSLTQTRVCENSVARFEMASFTCIKIVALAMGTKADEEAALQEANNRLKQHMSGLHRNQTILFPDKLTNTLTRRTRSGSSAPS